MWRFAITSIPEKKDGQILTLSCHLCRSSPLFSLSMEAIPVEKRSGHAKMPMQFKISSTFCTSWKNLTAAGVRSSVETCTSSVTSARQQITCRTCHTFQDFFSCQQADKHRQVNKIHKLTMRVASSTCHVDRMNFHLL